MGEETKDIITTNLGPRVISVLVQLGSGMNLVNEVMERRFYGSRYCLWPRWVMELVISLVALLVPNFCGVFVPCGSNSNIYRILG